MWIVSHNGDIVSLVVETSHSKHGVNRKIKPMLVYRCNMKQNVRANEKLARITFTS